jgi:hypothetical protein
MISIALNFIHLPWCICSQCSGMRYGKIEKSTDLKIGDVLDRKRSFAELAMLSGYCKLVTTPGNRQMARINAGARAAATGQTMPLRRIEQ